MRRHRPPMAGFLPILALVLAGPSRALAAPSPTELVLDARPSVPSARTSTRRSPAAVPDPPKLKLPAGAAPTGYSVELSIDPARPDFKGSVAIELSLKEKTSFL